MSKQLSTIKIQLTTKGQGTVNFDSPDQKFMLNKSAGANIISHDNTKIAKATYSKDANGNIVRTLKVSSQCIRQAIYCVKHNPNIMYSQSLFNDSISSMAALVLGYMHASDKRGTAKRKSPLTVTDAKEISGAIPTFNTHSNSGDRNDTSLYYVEEVGDTRFENTLLIDLSELKHIVLSDTYGRNSVFPDGEEALKAKLREKYGEISEGYYRMEGEDGSVPEYGAELSDEAVVAIVKDLIARIKQLRISRANGYLEFDSMKFFTFENGAWAPMDEPSDFTVKSRYVLMEDQEAAKKLHDDVCAQAKQDLASRKEAKAEEKAKKAAKKAEKGAK